MEFLAPKVEREIVVNGAETSDDVILECLDLSFSRVVAMIRSGCELEGDLSGIQKVLYCLGGFVIEEVESWALAAEGKILDQFGEDMEEFGVGAVFHWFDEDCVGIIVVEDEDVLMALAGRDWETAGKIGVLLFRWFEYGSHADVGWWFGNKRLCALQVFVFLVEVTAIGGLSDVEVLGDKVGIEARPRCEKSSDNDIIKSSFSWTEACAW